MTDKNIQSEREKQARALMREVYQNSQTSKSESLSYQLERQKEALEALEAHLAFDTKTEDFRKTLESIFYFRDSHQEQEAEEDHRRWKDLCDYGY